MASLVPANAPQGGAGQHPPGQGSVLEPLMNGQGNMGQRARAFAAQPVVKKALPWFVGMAGLGIAALLWATLAPGPQRVLYSSLDDASRASVVATLDQAGIDYQINNDTGALSVSESDLYRARMVVASNGSIAAPETGAQMIENLPLGASRTLEGDRLRAAQERELMLTVQEIDGVESVRVHIAKAERSVFVRENVAPSASIMVRMAPGRELAESQVSAIVNLVAGSVPGLSPDAVRVVDQHGKLLTDKREGAGNERLDLQTQMEAKLTAQVDQLLSPMIGADAFSSQVQVELDMNEVTSARESYDKDGAVRRETTQQSSTSQAPAAGIPGATANTPPADPQLAARAPQDTPPADGAQTMGDTSASRTYELGREVSVSNLTPGALKRVSVAVAIDKNAMANANAADIKKIEELVAAAVGAQDARGDKVTVMIRPLHRSGGRQAGLLRDRLVRDGRAQRGRPARGAAGAAAGGSPRAQDAQGQGNQGRQGGRRRSWCQRRGADHAARQRVRPGRPRRADPARSADRPRAARRRGTRSQAHARRAGDE